MVFASGNGFSFSPPNGNNIAYPASSKHTISVGAIDRSYGRRPYSEYSADLDFVALSNNSLGTILVFYLYI
jgi:hypothetical protein